MRTALPLLTLLILALPSTGCRREGAERRSWGSGWSSLFRTGHWHQDSWTQNGATTTFKLSGQATFNDTDSDLLSLSPGGTLTLTLEKDGARTTWEARQEGSGLTRTLNGKPGDTPEARAWLAGVLPEVLRHSGLFAEARAKRILAKEGAAGLEAEIQRLHTAHTKRLYFQAWLEAWSSDAKGIPPIVALAATQLDSDHELASLLGEVLERPQPSQDLRTAITQAAAKLGSDHERRRTLSAVLQAGPLTDALAKDVLQVGGAMASEYEKAELILEVLQDEHMSGTTVQHALQASSSLSSAYEVGRIAQQAAMCPNLDAASLKALVTRVQGIGSDFEKANALLAIHEHQKLDAAGRQSLEQAARSLGSEHERSRVLTAMAK